MMFILLGHCIGWTRAVPKINANTIMNADGEWSQSFVNAFIAVHPIAVDSFFVMGGLLLTRSMLSHIEKWDIISSHVLLTFSKILKNFRGTLNISKLYLHRYLRTTPVLAFLILVILSIFKYFGTGPFWNLTLQEAMKGQCEKYWWAALLHIQNYYNPIEVVSSYSPISFLN